MVIPLSVAPLWVVGISYLMAAGLFLTYWRSLWGPIARAFFRAALFSSAYWVCLALWLMATGPQSADLWARLNLPLAWLRQVGMAEAVCVLFGFSRTRPVRWLYSVGLVGIGVMLWPAAAGWMPVSQVPDGFWIGQALEPHWMWILRHIMVGTATLGGLGVLWGAYRHNPSSRAVWYFGMALVGVVLGINDDILTQVRHTLYPTLWIVGFFVLGVMWWELRAEVERTYGGLSRDPLTQAQTRTFGEFYGALRLKTQSVGMVYADVDFFKTVNDTWGHAVGDEVLRELVSRLSNACRASDRIVRLGGDEFIVIVPGVSAHDGRHVLRRLEAAVNRAPFVVDPEADPIPVSVSLGWSWGDRGSRFANLVAEADAAMYAVKRTRHGESDQLVLGRPAW